MWWLARARARPRGCEARWLAAGVCGWRHEGEAGLVERGPRVGAQDVDAGIGVVRKVLPAPNRVVRVWGEVRCDAQVVGATDSVWVTRRLWTNLN